MLRKVFLSLLLMMSIRGFSQSIISIDTSAFSYTFTDTVNLSTPNFAANVTIKNIGNIAILDTISVYVAVDTGSTGLHNYFNVYSYDSLAPGDTAVKSFSNPPTPALRSGINTVVIWPKANTPTTLTADSLFITVFVDTTGLGTYLHPSQKGFMVYPNPGQNTLHFKSFGTTNNYSFIRLFDAEGRLVIQTNFAENIDISALKQGPYLLVVTDKNGNEVKFRYIKD